MKKSLFLILILSVAIFSLFGCGEGGESAAGEGRSSGDALKVLVLCAEGGIEEQTGGMIAAYLSDMGYRPVFEREVGEDIAGVITVGSAEPDEEAPWAVRCLFSAYEKAGVEEVYTVSPVLSSKSIARAAVLLLPCAEKFSVISQKEGAADVQDACDFLDLCGVDYTVEAMDAGNVFGDLVGRAADGGSDVLILPRFENPVPMIDLSGTKTAVVAVGDGETVSGALASFCIDTEAMAMAAARGFDAFVKGETPAETGESFYLLCISSSAAEKYEVDAAAVSEDFNVVWVE